MISAMGDLEGKGKGGFVLLDEEFKVHIVSLSLSSLTLPTLRNSNSLHSSSPVAKIVILSKTYHAGEGTMVRYDNRVWL